MKRASGLHRGSIFLLVCASMSGLACSAKEIPPDFPGMRLRARVEAHLESRKDVLRRSLTHYGLVFEIEQRELETFMKPIRADRDGDDFVLGVVHGPESHGGGLLALLLGHWKPDSRPAHLEDAFWFEASRQQIRLDEIYRGHKQQVFLPAPAGEADDSGDARLPRMRFRYWTSPTLIETDAYKLLGLLLAQEEDRAATWRNHLDQELSVDRLLASARRSYLENRTSEGELIDHTRLHLVELLLAYDQRPGAGRDANEIQERFLDVELSRKAFVGEGGSESLCHYVESLGLLLQDPDVSWRPEEAKRVLEWLRRLEAEHFHQLEDIPLQHLAHLLKGLRLVEENWARLS